MGAHSGETTLGFQDLTPSDFHHWKIAGTGSATLFDPEPACLVVLRQDLREDGKYVQDLLLETELNASLCVGSDQTSLS